jgi:Zn finger protein HypA/HybF involved in hydrogenase expression
LGITVEAECDCGLTTQTDIGCGITDLGEICLCPFRCNSCRSVVTADLLSDKPTCESCGGDDVEPYTAESLHGIPGSEAVASWALSGGIEVTLTDGRYVCPACGKSGLRFSAPILHWD